MMTLETTLKEVVMGNGQDNFVLFYRPGHYDILYERILQENVNPEPTYWKSTTTKTYNRTVITRPAQINQLT